MTMSSSQWGREFRALCDEAFDRALRSTSNSSQWGREFRALCDAGIEVTSQMTPQGLNGAANSARSVTDEMTGSIAHIVMVSMGPRIPRAL